MDHLVPIGLAASLPGFMEVPSALRLGALSANLPSRLPLPRPQRSRWISPAAYRRLTTTTSQQGRESRCSPLPTNPRPVGRLDTTSGQFRSHPHRGGAGRVPPESLFRRAAYTVPRGQRRARTRRHAPLWGRRDLGTLRTDVRQRSPAAKAVWCTFPFVTRQRSSPPALSRRGGAQLAGPVPALRNAKVHVGSRPSPDCRRRPPQRARPDPSEGVGGAGVGVRSGWTVSAV